MCEHCDYFNVPWWERNEPAYVTATPQYRQRAAMAVTRSLLSGPFHDRDTLVTALERIHESPSAIARKETT